MPPTPFSSQPIRKRVDFNTFAQPMMRHGHSFFFNIVLNEKVHQHELRIDHKNVWLFDSDVRD